MNKKLWIAVLVSALPVTAMAAGENNIGSCGWGSKVFEGQRGMVPQVLGATTNGTFGNQTFGITSGTSGCTQDGLVSSNWKTAMFIDGNKEKLARDMSVGGGETLDALAKLIGIRDEDKATFFQVAKDNFGTIFSADAVTAEQILAGLKQAMATDAQLSPYSTLI